MATLDDAFGQALVAATADREDAGGLAGVVALTIGKSAMLVVAFDNGRVRIVNPVDEGEIDARIPFSPAQFEAWLSGGFNPAEAYMKGDLKPEGRSGPVAAALEVLADPVVISALSAATNPA